MLSMGICYLCIGLISDYSSFAFSGLVLMPIGIALLAASWIKERRAE